MSAALPARRLPAFAGCARPSERATEACPALACMGRLAEARSAEIVPPVRTSAGVLAESTCMAASWSLSQCLGVCSCLYISCVC